MAGTQFARQIGRIVRERRVLLNMTQQELAALAGTSVRLVISLELGESPGIRLDKLTQVLDALDLSLAVTAREGTAVGQGITDQASNQKHTRERDRYQNAFNQAIDHLGV